MRTSSVLKIAGAIVVFLILVSYGLFQAHDYITGPKISIDSPKNGETISSSTPEVLLKGRAENISFLTVNGLQIFTDENGNFERELLLPPGLAIITVEAQDKFSRSIRKEIQLFVK